MHVAEQGLCPASSRRYGQIAPLGGLNTAEGAQPGRSGSVNRSSRLDSVRYTSATTLVPQRLLTGDGTR
jgi:hypothetical protein